VIRRYRREFSVLTAFVLLLAIMAAVAPAFFRPEQLRVLLVSAAPVLVAAVGMTLVILSRNIDISIGSQFAICGVVAGLLSRAGVPLPLVVLGALLLGAALGTLNGALVAAMKLPSILVTLATLFILREALVWWREGQSVRDISPSFQWFGLGQGTGPWVVVAVALAVLVVFGWGMRHLSAGRAVYATGSDEEAARLAGIRPARVVFGVFVLMGVLSALAAVLNAIRFAKVDANAGEGLELQIIAAVVVGGTAVSGGRGTLFGTLAGVALLGSIGQALVFLGTRPQWEKAIQGVIILLAVASDALERRAR
jgi:rhamnose transport system permease protein